MSYEDYGAPTPPESPEIQRRLHLKRGQAVGILLLAVLPVLAIVGVLEARVTTAEARSDALAVEASFPVRLPYRRTGPLEVTVRNLSTQPLQIVVEVERRYVDGFSSVAFMPEPDTVTAEAYVVRLGDVAPGESRVVSTPLQADRYWLRTGTLTVRADDGAPLTIDLRTWVIP